MRRRVQKFFKTPKGQLTIILAILVMLAAPVEGYVRRMLWALAADGVIPEDACDDPWGPPLPAAEREAVRRAVRDARAARA